MENLLNTIFPPKCFFCEKYGSNICQRCIQECELILNSNCIVCDTPSMFGTTHIHCANNYVPITTTCLYNYRGHVRKIIKKAKYSQKKFSALKELSKRGINFAQKNGLSFSSEYLVVPVPLSKERYKNRGFNQATLIAKTINTKFNLKMTTKLLKRKMNTKTQHNYNRSNRFTNVEGAFSVSKSTRLLQTKILLVDDICTSGATFLEASKALYSAGAKEVHCFALSKRMKRKVAIKGQYW